MQDAIPLLRPWLDAAEIEAVAGVLRSGALVQGEKVAEFEARIAARCQRRYAIATANGTAALQLSLTALGIGAADEVICPDLSWPSPAHAIAALGARPLLVDVDADEWNVDARLLPQARRTRCRAAIVIDQFGNPARRREIAAALGDLPIIEDAACALGSRFAEAPCGSFGVISCLSFHPRKILTTGEGGMCLTDDEQLASTLRVLRNHGQAAPGQFVRAAGNHRLTELAAAIGLAQLGKLDEQIEARGVAVALYRQRLEAHLRFQQTPPGAAGNQQTCGALLPPGSSAAQRDGFLQRLRQRGVQASLLSYALHCLPSLSGSVHIAAPGESVAGQAADIAARGFALPLYRGLTAEAQERVIAAVLATL